MIDWSTRGIWRFTLATALLLSGLCGQAHAQVKDEARYDELIAEGVAEFERGNWVEARAFFGQAHAMRPSARTLRGLGYVAYELRDYVEAAELLRDALAHQEKPLEPDQRVRAKALLKQLQALIGTYRIQRSPEDALLVVDGEELAVHMKTLRLSAGSHTLVAQAEGYQALERALEVRGGEQEALELTLKPTEPAASPQLYARTADDPSPLARGGLAPDTGATPMQADDDSILESPLFWTGAAILVAGGVVLALLLTQSEDPASPVEPGTGIMVSTAPRWP